MLDVSPWSRRGKEQMLKPQPKHAIANCCCHLANRNKQQFCVLPNYFSACIYLSELHTYTKDCYIRRVSFYQKWQDANHRPLGQTIHTCSNCIGLATYEVDLSYAKSFFTKIFLHKYAESRKPHVHGSIWAEEFHLPPPPKKKTTHAAMGPEGYHAYLKKNFSWVTLTDQYSTEVSRFSRDSSDFNSGKI